MKKGIYKLTRNEYTVDYEMLEDENRGNSMKIQPDRYISERFREYIKNKQEAIYMQFEKLQKDMIAAMKAKDKSRKDSISSLISAVKKVAIDEGVREIR